MLTARDVPGCLRWCQTQGINEFDPDWLVTDWVSHGWAMLRSGPPLQSPNSSIALGLIGRD